MQRWEQPGEVSDEDLVFRGIFWLLLVELSLRTMVEVGEKTQLQNLVTYGCSDPCNGRSRWLLGMGKLQFHRAGPLA